MVPVLIAPRAQLRRTDVRLRRQSQLPDLHFELRGKGRATKKHRLSPIGVAAPSDCGWVRRAHRPKSYSAGGEFAVGTLQMRVGRSEFGGFVPGFHEVEAAVENLAAGVLEKASNQCHDEISKFACYCM